MEFKDAFDKLLSESRLSLKQVSNDTNIDVNLLKLYLNGDAKPDSTDKKIIANYFKVDIDELLKQELKSEDKISDPKYLNVNRILTFVILCITFIYLIIAYIDIFEYQETSIDIIPISIIGAGELEENYVGITTFYTCLVNVILSTTITLLDYLKVKIHPKIIPNLRITNYLLFIVNLFLIFFSFVLTFSFVI